MLLFASLVVIALMSIVIMYACNSFEDAADYLGRNMKPGVKGATINAIGSSLPELFTTALLLFGPLFAPDFFGSRADGFSAGIATCAGSAVFNAVIIPGLCVLAVLFLGVKGPGGTRTKVDSITLDKKVVIKDGIFFVGAELALIYFLGDTTVVWWMGGALVVIYLVYIFVTLRTGFGVDEEEDDDEDEDDDEEAGAGLLGLGWLLDANARFFGGRDFTRNSAWVVLGISIAYIALACAGIAWAVEHSAQALGVQPYFTAVILAAAATSVPDTVLSVKDALKGNYDDAVANAVGSNIFDICVCLGLPLMIYGLTVGAVELVADGAAADVQILRWVLLAVTAVVLALFLIGRGVGRAKAVLLFGMYFVWTAFVVGRGMGAEWAAVDDWFGAADAPVDAVAAAPAPAAPALAAPSPEAPRPPAPPR